MKKLNENKASIALVLFAVALVLAVEVHDLTTFILLFAVSGTSGIIGGLLWNDPTGNVTLQDPETGEIGDGIHARDLAQDLLLKAWHYVRVPVLVTFALACIFAFWLLVWYGPGVFKMSVIF